jgi:hypothetical protein
VNILLVHPFRGLVPAFRKPPVILKIVQKPAMNVHWRNSTNESERKPEQKFVTVQSLELVSVFKEASKNFTFIFLFNMPG